MWKRSTTRRRRAIRPVGAAVAPVGTRRSSLAPRLIGLPSPGGRHPKRSWRKTPAEFPYPRPAGSGQVMTLADLQIRHSLVGNGEDIALEYDTHGAPMPQVLGAVYAASKLTYRARPEVFRLMRRATRWDAGNNERLIPFLTGDEATRAWRRTTHDEAW